ncbi:hypothetical protein K6W78_29440, partial [Burkholderia cepacia]|uniref:hypothetical protein n=1 Tax=Burkholderia cepacia TaxID=292 RepID=UPI001C94CBDD
MRGTSILVPRIVSKAANRSRGEVVERRSGSDPPPIRAARDRAHHPSNAEAIPLPTPHDNV